MPYIAFNTSKNLSEQEKIGVKSMLGKSISLLSGKQESKLMIDLSDNRTMYFGGEKKENLVFIDVRLYQMISIDDRKNFTEAVFKGINEICKIKNDEIFLNFIQLETWGTNGVLK